MLSAHSCRRRSNSRFCLLEVLLAILLLLLLLLLET
jgi:hypothetical protein